MLPRGKIDIAWSDLAFAARRSFRGCDRDAAQRAVEARWSPNGDTLATLSVRSAFDLWLRARAFPPGSEVLVSAVTIRDMTRILEEHGLVPVPVELDVGTLAVTREALEARLTKRTRAVVVAHLFGSRMPLDGLVALTQERGLPLVEDCAQAYVADTYRGHPGCDVALFSFGPIKTNTALGGGLAVVRERATLACMRTL
jgi:perosamine synthetase